MTAPRSRFSGPRYALTALGVAALVFTSLFVLGGFIDLDDGKTWNKRSRYESGPLWYPVVEAESPKEFRSVLMFRYMLPVVIFGTATVVCFLGAAAQPKRPMA